MKNGIKSLAMWLITFIIFIVLISSIIDNTENRLAYSELLSKVEARKPNKNAIAEIEKQSKTDNN